MRYKLKDSNNRIYPLGVHWSYATKSGGPVLRDATTPKNINGIWIGFPRSRVWILFRRPPTWR